MQINMEAQDRNWMNYYRLVSRTVLYRPSKIRRRTSWNFLCTVTRLLLMNFGQSEKRRVDSLISDKYALTQSLEFTYSSFLATHGHSWVCEDYH